MYDMAENNEKTKLTPVSLTAAISWKTVLSCKIMQKTSLTNVYSFAD